MLTCDSDEIKTKWLYLGEIAVLERRCTYGTSNDVHETTIYTNKIGFQ